MSLRNDSTETLKADNHLGAEGAEATTTRLGATNGLATGERGTGDTGGDAIGAELEGDWARGRDKGRTGMLLRWFGGPLLDEELMPFQCENANSNSDSPRGLIH